MDLTKLRAKTVYAARRKHKRELIDMRRLETAEQALALFDRETTIYGFTKGQFSVIDLLTAALKLIGPAELVISTWTACQTDVTTVLEFVDSGLLTGARWMVDLTFQRRSPELANRIRQVFGADAIRVAKNHAKFALLANADWKVVIQTSMNLNFNPRFENFTISHDPDLYAFHAAIIEEIWARQSTRLADARPYDIQRFFRDQM